MSTHTFAHAQKRRSTRIDQNIPLVVQGVGAMREPYQERVLTLSVSCHGCSYQSKTEVIQGETVFLDIKPLNNGVTGYSSKAKVKWAQKLGTGKDRIFQIAVELENAGNVWGVASPPPDWFPPRHTEAIEPTNSGRELKLVARNDQAMIAPPDLAAIEMALPALPVASESDKPAVAPLAQLMVGLGEQIQNMASEAASAALVREKGRLIEEFRTQLREEAIKTVHAAISASRDTIVRQAMKELSQAYEAGARHNYNVWINKVQQDMESARQHVLSQEKQVGQRLDALAARTIERVQRNMEATRSEAVDRFVSRLRDQIVPMLSEAKDALQQLQATEAALKKDSEAVRAGFENQLAFSANSTLAKSHEELERNSSHVATKTNETLMKLYQDFETAAQENVSSLLVSLGGQVTKIVEEKANEVSREFSTGLEGYTRNYLETIGKSIAEIPRNLPGSSRS